MSTVIYFPSGWNKSPVLVYRWIQERFKNLHTKIIVIRRIAPTNGPWRIIAEISDL